MGLSGQSLKFKVQCYTPHEINSARFKVQLLACDTEQYFGNVVMVFVFQCCN